jgi:hypothetical protein
MELHIARNDQEFGPYSLDEVNAKLASGELNYDDLAWFDGEPDWKPLREILGDSDPSESVAQEIVPAANDTVSDGAGKKKPKSAGGKFKSIVGTVVGVLSLASIAWFLVGGTDWGIRRDIIASVRDEFGKDANLSDVEIERFILLDGSGDRRSGNLTCSHNGKQVVLSVAVTIDYGAKGFVKFLGFSREVGWEIPGEEMLKFSTNPYLADPKTRHELQSFAASFAKIQPSFDAFDKAWETSFSANSDREMLSKLQTLVLPVVQSLLTDLKSLPEPTPEARNMKNAFQDLLKTRQTVAQLYAQAIVEDSSSKLEQANNLIKGNDELNARIDAAVSAYGKSFDENAFDSVSGGAQQ